MDPREIPSSVASSVDNNAAPKLGHDGPKRGAMWPCVVAICIALLIAGPASVLIALTLYGSFDEVARAFLEGGVFMYLLLLFNVVAVVGYCTLAYFHIVWGKLPGSLLLLPPAAAAIVGITGESWGMTQITAALGQAAPEQRQAFLFRGLSIAGNCVFFGYLVAATVAWIATMFASARALSWGQNTPRPKLGWFVLGGGFMASLVVIGVTSASDSSSMLTLWLGAMALFLVVLVGFGAISPLNTWRDGANQIVLAVASIGTLLLVWMAANRFAFIQSTSTMDLVAPEQQANLALRGEIITDHIDLVGWLSLAVVGVVALGALAVGARQVVASITRFGAHSILAAVVVFAIAGTVFKVMDREERVRELLDFNERNDPAYFVRNNADFLPAQTVRTSYLTRHLTELVPTVIVNRDQIWVDDQPVASTKGFSAKSSGGQALRGALSKKIEAWEAQRREQWGDAEVEAEVVSDLLLPESERGGGQSPRTRDPWRLDEPALAVHREVPFATVGEVVSVLRDMRYNSARFIVSTIHLPRPQEVTKNLPARFHTSPADFGVVQVAIGPGQCRAKTNEARGEFEGLDLSLEITDQGYTLVASGGVLPEGCASSIAAIPSERPTVPLKSDAMSCADEHGYPTPSQRQERTKAELAPPPCAYGVERLSECFERIGDEYPEEREVLIAPSSTVDFQTLVHAMDAARGNDGRLFGDLFLFVGDDMRQTCKIPRPPAEPFSPNTGPIGLGGAPPSYSGGQANPGGASVPTIRTGSAAIRGSLSKEVIRGHIRRHINQIRFCYEQQLAREPELSGRVAIRFVISTSGAVSSSSVASSTIENQAVESCVARAIRRIEFPPPDGGGVVIVTYPFMFQTED